MILGPFRAPFLGALYYQKPWFYLRKTIIFRNPQGREWRMHPTGPPPSDSPLGDSPSQRSTENVQNTLDKSKALPVIPGAPDHG